MSQPSVIEVPPRSTNRITVVEHVYLQSAGETEPKAVSLSYSRQVESTEQPYERFCKASRDWSPVDYGWIRDPGMVIIASKDGKFTQTYPSDEERKAMENRIIEVSLGDYDCVLTIPPGEALRISPSDSSKVKIRCLGGPARYVVYAFPR